MAGRPLYPLALGAVIRGLVSTLFRKALGATYEKHLGRRHEDSRRLFHVSVCCRAVRLVRVTEGGSE